MQQHLVGVKVLSDDIISVDSDDSQTQEQMEVIRLVVGPASFPHAERDRFCELSFEASGNAK